MTPTPTGRSGVSRLPELDSLRGLAALSVFLHHCLRLVPGFYDEVGGSFWYLNSTPLHAIWAGPEAVMLFFVLSGFVLSLPWHEGRPPGYGTFVLKRAFRLYPAYLVALVLVAALDETFVGRSVFALTPATTAPTVGFAGTLRDHLLMLPSFKWNTLDLPMWSLVHEMRISLLFPLLMALVLTARRRAALPFLAAAALVLAFLTSNVDIRRTDYFITPEYAMMFLAGALLARWRRLFPALLARSPLIGVGVVALGVALYTYPYWFLARQPVAHMLWLNSLVSSAGGALFVIAALGITGVRRALRSRPLLVAGRASYSLYLLHSPILLVLVFTLAPRWGLPAPILLAWAMVLPLAVLCQRWIETPGIHLGAMIADALARRTSRLRSRFRTASVVDDAEPPVRGHAVPKRL